jgi:hypothetical protein
LDITSSEHCIGRRDAEAEAPDEVLICPPSFPLPRREKGKNEYDVASDSSKKHSTNLAESMWNLFSDCLSVLLSNGEAERWFKANR